MEIRVLGPLEVWAAGEAVPIRRGRPRKLFLALLLRLGERVSADLLIEELWGDDPPRNATNALQILVSNLRRALSATAGGAVIETVEGGYRLIADRASVDAFRLESVVATAPALPDAEQRLKVLEDALATWRGSPLAEVTYDAFAQGDIRRLEEARLTAQEQRIDALLALGRPGEAVAELQQLVVEHPLREGLAVRLMTALYRTGRQTEALHVFDGVQTALVEQLGLDPGPELQSVRQAILEQSPDLHPAASTMVAAAPAVPLPPAAPVATPQTAAPAILNPLIAREHEVAALGELVGERRLVTLTGPGGAGKTRLALHLHQDALAAGRPTWWVDLSPAVDADSVAASLAAAAGITTDPDVDDTGFIGKIAGREGLLVLDTCEHVLTHIRPFVTEIVRSAPGLTLVATSRQPLGLPGERVWPVPPLDLPDPDVTDAEEIAASGAVRLFVNRATDVNPEFALTPDNADTIATGCRLLDGLPLAIELAAGQAAVLDVGRMVPLLGDRFRLLVDEARDDRQHTLRATIDWSYRLLSRDQTVLFHRLAVFSGPFSLDAALLVCGEGLSRDPLDVFLGLVRQSLVSVAGADRYRLLDTIREFALEKHAAQADADRAAVQERHASWYADYVAQAERHLRGPDAQGWLAELREALPNIRSALRWCFDPGGDTRRGARMASNLTFFWGVEGAFAEAATWLDAAKAVTPPGTTLHAALLAGSGMHASSRGDLATAVAECGAGAELFRSLDQPLGEAHTLLYCGIAHWGRGEDADAARRHDRAALLFGELGNDWGLGLSLMLRGRTALELDEPATEEILLRAEAVARRSGDWHVIALCLNQRARVALSRGNPAEAEPLAAQSLALNEAVGYREGVVASLNSLGLARRGKGDGSVAELHWRAFTVAREMNHAGSTAEGLECLALAVVDDRHEEAARLLAAAEHLRDELRLRRAAPLAGLVAELQDRLAELLSPDDLARARADGALLDIGTLTVPLAGVTAS